MRGDLVGLNACPDGGEADLLVLPFFAQRHPCAAGYRYEIRAPHLVISIGGRRLCLEQQTNTITARIAAELEA